MDEAKGFNMKMKNHIEKQTTKQNELDWSFAQWLDHFRNEPTSKELDDMEKRSANNINFKPFTPIGA